MILGSRFVKPLRKEAEDWKKNIQTLSEMVEEWLKLQRSWMYLRTIFNAKDIAKVLAHETAEFGKVNKFFIGLMKKVEKQYQCMRFVTHPGNQSVLAHLKANNAVLEECNNRLEDYMQEKREAFPRFYFLSNDELIDILANSQELDVIQLHLKTLFDNLVRMKLNEDSIEGIISGEKEEVELKKKPKARNAVEGWLRQLQDEMVNTLALKMREGVNEYQTQERKQFVLTHAGQIVATIAQIMWCQNTEEAIGEQSGNPLALQDAHEQNRAQIAILIAMVRGSLTGLQRKVIVALITTDVHAADIVEELEQDKVSSIYDFRW